VVLVVVALVVPICCSRTRSATRQDDRRLAHRVRAQHRGPQGLDTIDHAEVIVAGLAADEPGWEAGQGLALTHPRPTCGGAIWAAWSSWSWWPLLTILVILVNRIDKRVVRCGHLRPPWPTPPTPALIADAEWVDAVLAEGSSTPVPGPCTR
jgi:hypothetical protein